jgi:hypothetical protein
MRLIDVETYELRELNPQTVDYAILSHTWAEYQEVTFQDWQAYLAKHEPRASEVQSRSGFNKIIEACGQSRKDGWKYLWADTICIDKSSSAELEKSINLMFSWYQSAAVCYVYLHDTYEDNQRIKWTKDPSQVRTTPKWFTRGWTLQELLAPKTVLFYDQRWKYIGDRREVARVIKKFTGIPMPVLHGGDIRSHSRAERVSWSMGRETKEPEDRAYSLLGLLGVSIPVSYGIGAKNAFLRLQEAMKHQKAEEILQVTADEHLSTFMQKLEGNAEGVYKSCNLMTSICAKFIKGRNWQSSTIAVSNLARSGSTCSTERNGWATSGSLALAYRRALLR